jgi:hypothetical protein
MFLGYIVLQLFCIYSLCYSFAREIIIIITTTTTTTTTLDGNAWMVYTVHS